MSGSTDAFSPIWLDGEVEGDELPDHDDRSWGQILRARSDFRRWIRGTANAVTITDGKVAAVADLGGGGNVFAQATAARRPVMSNAEDEATSALSFDGAAWMPRVADPVNWTQPWTMVAVTRATQKEAAIQYRAVCGAQDSGTARHGILYARRNTTAPDPTSFPVWTAAHGAGQVTVFGVWDELALVIVSFDGTTLRMWFNDAEPVSIATTAALAVTNQYQLAAINNAGGYAYLGTIEDMVWFQADGNADSALLVNQLKNWAASAFAELGLTPPAVP
jgi:hypothetical protein